MEEGGIQDLFPSQWMNSCVDKWMENLLRDQFEEWSLKDLYVKEQAPKTITAQILLDNLDSLKESDERYKKLFYKGKIMPEHLVHNIHVEEREDSSCIDKICSCLREQMNNLIEVRREE